MSRSIWFMEAVRSMADLAADSSPPEREAVTTSMASWAVRDMAVSSSFSSNSSASNVLRILVTLLVFAAARKGRPLPKPPRNIIFSPLVPQRAFGPPGTPAISHPRRK